MITINDLGKLGGITDREEMIRVCAEIPEEDLRNSLVLLALAWNTSIEINEMIDRKIIKK